MTERDTSYSPDVEIDENGNLVYTRDIQVGEWIRIPGHMMGKVIVSAVQFAHRQIPLGKSDD